VTVEINGEAGASPSKEGSTEILKVLSVTSEIKNLGKTSAIINKIDHKLTFVGECKVVKMVGAFGGELFDGLTGKEVLPNLTFKTLALFHIPPECEGKRVSFFCHGVIHYTDTVSGIPYVQDFSTYISIPEPTSLPSPSASSSASP